MVRLSVKLNLIVVITTLGLIIFWIGRVYGTECFNWIDYSVSFGTLFVNSTINIMGALGR